MANIRGNAVGETIDMGTPVFVAVTPSDVTTYTTIRSVYCVTAGTLQAENLAGVTVPIAMTAGQTIPISPGRIRATTTGTYVALQ